MTTHDRSPDHSRLTGPWSVLALIVGIALLVWGGLRYEDARTRELRFQGAADELVRRFEAQFNTIEQIMLASAGLVSVQPNGTADQWADYLDRLELPRIARLGATGVGFLERVEHAHLPRHLARMRSTYPAYTVWPAGTRSVYFPLVLPREPLPMAQRAPFGYDPYADPTRRRAMDRAHATGEVSYSDVVHLKTYDGRTGAPTEQADPAIAMYAPVFDKPSHVGTDRHPAQPHLGFLVSVVHLRSMIDNVMGSSPAVNLAIRVPGSAERITSTGHAPEIAPRFERAATIRIGGAQWQLTLQSTGSMPRLRAFISADLVLVGGVLLAFAVFFRSRAVERNRLRVEADLREARADSDQRFRDLADTAPFIAWMSNSDLRVTYVNARWWQYATKDPGTLPPEGIEMVGVHRDDVPRLVAASGRGQAFAEVVRLRRHDGVFRWFMVSGEPKIGANGERVGYVGTAVDVHDQHTAQELLRVSQERYQLSVGASGTGIWEWDLLSGRLFCSGSFMAMMEIDPAMLATTPDGLGDGYYMNAQAFEDFDLRVHPKDRLARERALRALMRDRVPLDLVLRVRSRSGEYRHYHSHGDALWDDQGRAIRCVGTLTDVTDLKSAEQEAQRSHAFLEAVLNAIPNPIVVKDEQLRWSLMNDAFVSAFHVDSRSAIGKTDAELLPPQVVERTSAEDRAVLDTGVPIHAEVRSAIVEGKTRWFLKHKSLITMPSGDRFVVSASTDIHDRKLAELQAERSRQFLDAILNGLPVPVFVKDRDHRWILVNDAGARQFGRPREELIGRSDADFLPEAYARAAFEEEDGLWESGARSVREAQLPIPGHSPQWILKTKSVVALGDGSRYLIGLNLDITDRKRAELELERGRQFVDAVIDAIPIPVFVKDHDHRWVLVNEAASQQYHTPKSALIGQSDRTLFPVEYAEEAEAEDDALWRDGGKLVREAEILYPGQEPRWMLKTKVGAILSDGSRYIIAAALDITSRRQAEEALREHRDRLEDLVAARTRELARAKDSAEAANQAKSEFLANMSHELRTPMHAILSFARLGSERIASGRVDAQKLGQYLNRIAASGSRLLTLLNDLLDLSKLEAGRMNYEFAAHDLRSIVSGVIDELSAVARERGVTLEAIAPDGPVPAWCDAARVAQVVRNILGNAIKFTPQAGRVSVETGLCELQDGDEGLPGARFSVTDEGTGIPAGELEAVFDKFVQSSKTKSGAGGTGLGLAICREIVSQHSGRVWAENAPGGGARFVVVLPGTAADVLRDVA